MLILLFHNYYKCIDLQWLTNVLEEGIYPKTITNNVVIFWCKQTVVS